MCDECSTIAKAREALDDLLGLVALDVVRKGPMDLSTRAGFDRAAGRLSRELGRRTGKVDADMVRASIGVLDVDWGATTAEQRARLVSRASAAAKKAATPVVEEIRAPFDEHAEEVVRGTKLETKNRQKLAITATFTNQDRKVVTHCTKFQCNFVRDEYGRRVEGFSAKAREVVASGLDQGLGSDDIAENLQAAAKAAFIQKSPNYWDVVASAFTGHSRSYSQMSSYTEAGIERYQIVAVLDEQTTPQCRYLDRKTFSVGKALSRFEQMSETEDPEDVRKINPWIRMGMVDGKPSLWVPHGEGKSVIAEIVRSGVGNRDDAGEYLARMSDSRLDLVGIGPPPYHGYCRSTTIAVV